MYLTFFFYYLWDHEVFFSFRIFLFSKKSSRHTNILLWNIRFSLFKDWITYTQWDINMISVFISWYGITNFWASLWERLFSHSQKFFSWIKYFVYEISPFSVTICFVWFKCCLGNHLIIAIFNESKLKYHNGLIISMITKDDYFFIDMVYSLSIL